MPQFDSGAAEPIGRFSEGFLLRLLQFLAVITPIGIHWTGYVAASSDATAIGLDARHRRAFFAIPGKESHEFPDCSGDGHNRSDRAD
jgi:hypothetical protein